MEINLGTEKQRRLEAWPCVGIMVPIAERFEAETQLDGSELYTWFDIPL